MVGCNFTDISCSAVQLGIFGDISAPPERQNRALSVTDCVVRQTPSELHGCAGIIAGYVADTTVSHNDLAGLSNAGIAVGWGWGAKSYARSNDISYNRVDGSESRLADGGSIYTLSPQPGSTISYNYLSDQRLRDAPLYHDEGSGGFHTHHNVVDNAQNCVAPRDNSHMWSCEWLHMNQMSADIRIDHIWTNQPNFGMKPGLVNITLADIFNVTGKNFPAEARAVMHNAGVRQPPLL